MSTPIEALRERLVSRFPAIAAYIDEPMESSGTWWLDLRLDNETATVQWRQDRGFGLTARSGVVFGELADEAIKDADAVYDKIVRLLLSRGETKPPSMDLQDLRKHRSVMQEDLAAALRVGQSSVSRLERRSDVRVGTLASLIEALGGELEIRALFPDEVIKLRFSPQ